MSAVCFVEFVAFLLCALKLFKDNGTHDVIFGDKKHAVEFMTRVRVIEKTMEFAKCIIAQEPNREHNSHVIFG